MELKDLTEAERMAIEKMRALKQSDEVFEHLPIVLADRFSIMVDRGVKYNGSVTGVMDQIFDVNDQSAYHRASDPTKRLKNICTKSDKWLSDEELFGLVDDAANYNDMWLCCRMERKINGAA